MKKPYDEEEFDPDDDGDIDEPDDDGDDDDSW